MADGSGAAAAATDAGGAGAAAAATADQGGQGGGAAAPGPGAGTAAIENAAAAAPGPWHGELTPEDIGWLQTKAWFGADVGKADVPKSFPHMVKGYRNMESLLGKNRLAMPRDAADTEGWSKLYTELGRPASWQAYELKVGEGADQTVADGFAEIAFAEGLSTRQAQNLAKNFGVFAQKTNAASKEAAEKAYGTRSQQEYDAIVTEWGGQADAKLAAGQRARVALGWDEAQMDKLERAMGTTDFLKHMAEVGSMVSEDRGAGGGGSGFSHMTPEQAKARLKEMQGDGDFIKRYQAGEAEAVKEKRQIDEVLANAAAR